MTFLFMSELMSENLWKLCMTLVEKSLLVTVRPILINQSNYCQQLQEQT